jgi:hypothetical protein
MLRPLIVTACLLRPGSWRLAYLIVAVILSALVLLFLLTRRRWINSTFASCSKDTNGESAFDVAESLHEPPALSHSETTRSKSPSATRKEHHGHRIVQLSIIGTKLKPLLL